MILTESHNIETARTVEISDFTVRVTFKMRPGMPAEVLICPKLESQT